MAANSQQKSSRRGKATVNAIELGTILTKQLASLMRKVQGLKLKQVDSAAQQNYETDPCGVCMETGHSTDTCPRMGEFTGEGEAEAYAMQGYLPTQQPEQRQSYEQPQQQFNSGWNRPNNSGW